MAYIFPLSIQLTLPELYQQDDVFHRVLETLSGCGFSGLELNILQTERIEPARLSTFLKHFDLRMTMFASGAAAKTEGLSLSSADQRVRRKSVDRCLDFIRFAEHYKAGVIVGFLKGGVEQNRESARACFQESLTEIVPAALKAEVPILIEATNRYESVVANSLEDAHSLIARFGDTPYLRILPDTFHMNIEERDQFSALEKYADFYDSIHISDNNRYFPGLGAIRFDQIVDFLKGMGYRGGIAIEGNVKEDLVSDIRATMEYLQPFIESSP